jgi:hypothetical protein
VCVYVCVCVVICVGAHLGHSIFIDLSVAKLPHTKQTTLEKKQVEPMQIESHAS